MIETTRLIFRSYNAIIKDLDVLRDLLEVTMQERENWWIGGRLFHSVPLDNAAKRVDMLSSRIEKLSEAIDELEEKKRLIQNKLSELDGIEYKVAYKRYVEGKDLQQIANEVDRSHEHVRRLHAKINATSMIQTG
ncbi:hypothetical protein M3689_05690 [Alkalihalophilus marmarensis]|uniref:hypothetical protein n=1 Tax=Alkalihalophilus marmarensis TaxID=521377 RepID=UPI00204236F3|nr:hypothetical protein [Alkalihalophilus marmarensis]MCM3488797.1 hypothetical protein [Alkalihalophilus marmarensis]